MGIETSFVLNDPDSEHIRISVSARAREPAGEYYDDNWLVARISIRVTGFRADFPASLSSIDLSALRDALVRLATGRSMREDWEPIEPWLILRIDMGRDGEEVAGVANQRLIDGNSLRFSMPLARRVIDRAVDQLDLLLVEFPVLGSPSSP